MAGEQQDILRCVLIFWQYLFYMWCTHGINLFIVAISQIELKSWKYLKSKFQLLQICLKKALCQLNDFWLTGLLWLSLGATCNCCLQLGWLRITLQYSVIYFCKVQYCLDMTFNNIFKRISIHPIITLFAFVSLTGQH